MKYLISILLLVCAGCTTVPNAVITPQKETVNIPPDLLKECPLHLQSLDQKTYTESATVEGPIQTWANQHDTCARNHNALIRIVIRAFNITPEKEKVVEKAPK